MKIAIAQTEICFEEPEKNLRTAESWIEQAAQEGADAIFFPEMSFTGFSMHVEKVAAYVNPIRQTMCRLAAQEHIAIGYGWTSCKSGGKGENHYTILGKSGEVLSDYVKIHPFSYGGEERFYDSGTEIVHTVLEDFPVSTLICYDLRFPELFRAAAQTSRLIVVPANWLHQRTEHWLLLLRARAIENQVYVLGVNCVGKQQSYTFDGQSWIEQAAQEGADAIFFPEMSFTGFSMHVEKVAAYVNPIRQTMCRLAAQEHIAIGYGWTSCKSGGKGENHYTILGKSGEVLSDYVKIHPFSYGGEERFYDSGTEIVHTVLEDFPVSTLICYDLRFPELFRAAAQTSRLIVVPANWLHQRTEHWLLLLRARAIENQVYVLGVNCVGKQQSYTFDGQSCLADPEGNLCCVCGDAPELAFVTVENDTEQFRRAFPTCRDVKLPFYTELYQNLVREEEHQ